MRTTLELDDDVLSAAKRLAHDQGLSIGEIISRLARQSLSVEAPPKIRNGVPVFVPKLTRKRPDLHLVNDLRDE